MKSEREKELMRDENNTKRKLKRAQENPNQKFWRLIRRRQKRKRGFHLKSIEREYHRSIQKYGLYENNPSQSHHNEIIVVELSEVGMKTEMAVFNDMLDLVHAGKPFPLDKFKIFDHYGISLSLSFFRDYLKDMSKNSER